jgi:hypothetical protein
MSLIKADKSVYAPVERAFTQNVIIIYKVCLCHYVLRNVLMNITQK